MAHNSRVRGASDAWANIQPAELAQLDVNIAAGINGAEGSAHSPATPIVLTGSGLQLTGPLTIARGGSVTMTSAGGIVLDGGYPSWVASTDFSTGAVITPSTLNGRRYLCTTPGESGSTEPTWPTAYTATVQDGTVVWTCLGPDGDVPKYGPGHVGRTPTVVHALAGGRPAVPGTWRVRNVDGMAQAIAPMMDISDGNGPQPARWLVPLRMHDAATVTTVSVSFRVGWPHAALPSVMPGARLLRLPSSGIPQFLTSVAAGADPSGYVYVQKPSTAAAWTGQQTLTLECDQNNVIDVANFTYVLELIEEQWTGGPQYPWSLVMKQPCACASTAALIFEATPPSTVDGVTLAFGTRILVKDGLLDASSASVGDGNGIWLAQGGTTTWIRAADFDAASDFTQAVIVPVAAGGAANGGSSWQSQTSKSTWGGGGDLAVGYSPDIITFLARGPDDDENKVNTGAEFFAHGCIWGAASVSYSDITQQDFA